MARRTCFGCHCELAPFSNETYTMHEFECGKKYPSRVPRRWAEHHQRELEREQRSKASFRNVATRRLNAGQKP